MKSSRVIEKMMQKLMYMDDNRSIAWMR